MKAGYHHNKSPTVTNYINICNIMGFVTDFIYKYYIYMYEVHVQCDRRADRLTDTQTDRWTEPITALVPLCEVTGSKTTCIESSFPI